MKFFANNWFLLGVGVAIIGSCGASGQKKNQQQNAKTQTVEQTKENKKPEKVKEIALPSGYKRLPADSGSFAFFLQKLSLKKDSLVRLFNGQLKLNQSAQYAIIDIDVGSRDLQQCADAVMRLRAEYLFETKQFDKIKFHFTSGHLAEWSKYAQGYRAKISGNTVTWVKTATPDNSYTCFRQYMDLVFSYCGTKSMNNEVSSISIKEIKPGDVFHETGNPYGHAITVMDVAQDSTGNPIFLLAQSYMPAQDIHILINPTNTKLNPWYSLKEGQSLITPEWHFPSGSLKRWK
ncbi:MAG: DUF4846 domain-containing protein [Flavobacteriales bacterium]|nr:DUF4846 domain-containing protein [Flavobacteriales bacterium]